MEKGKVIPLEKLGDTSSCAIYITLIPISNSHHMTEQKILTLVSTTDMLLRKGKLREIKSLKELDS